MEGPVTVLNFFLGVGTIALLVGVAIIEISWIAKSSVHRFVGRHASLILRILFLGGVAGSLTYDIGFHYAPCLLCWYQRLAIFPIALLVWTADIGNNALLRRQVTILSVFGLAVALFHNYLDIFQPSGVDVCGTSGVSCLVRYVYEFGFVTIPLMSLALLLAGLLVTRLSSYPQAGVAETK